MNTLINQIQQEQIQARKNRETFKASLLTTLLGEAKMVGKNAGNREPTDEEVIKVVQKFIKGNNEIIAVNPSETSLQQAKQENDILKHFLPSQLTENELMDIIAGYIRNNSVTNMKQMGQVMKFLKENYDGQYEGKQASSIVRRIIGATGMKIPSILILDAQHYAVNVDLEEVSLTELTGLSLTGIALADIVLLVDNETQKCRIMKHRSLPDLQETIQPLEKIREFLGI